MPEGTKVSMDNGYFSGANLQYLEQKRLDGYIPDSKQVRSRRERRLRRVHTRRISSGTMKRRTSLYAI